MHHLRGCPSVIILASVAQDFTFSWLMHHLWDTIGGDPVCQHGAGLLSVGRCTISRITLGGNPVCQRGSGFLFLWPIYPLYGLPSVTTLRTNMAQVLLSVGRCTTFGIIIGDHHACQRGQGLLSVGRRHRLWDYHRWRPCMLTWRRVYFRLVDAPSLGLSSVATLYANMAQVLLSVGRCTISGIVTLGDTLYGQHGAGFTFG